MLKYRKVTLSLTMNDYKTIEWKDYDKLSSKKGKYKVVSYYQNGNVEDEGYIINNSWHKEDGPAIIWYYKNGNIELEKYWLCDKFLTKEEYYSQKIQVILDIAKMMDTWESKFNFIKLSLRKELNE